MFEIKLKESQFKGLEILYYINLDCFSCENKTIVIRRQLNFGNF